MILPTLPTWWLVLPSCIFTFSSIIDASSPFWMTLFSQGLQFLRQYLLQYLFLGLYVWSQHLWAELLESSDSPMRFKYLPPDSNNLKAWRKIFFLPAWFLAPGTALFFYHQSLLQIFPARGLPFWNKWAQEKIHSSLGFTSIFQKYFLVASLLPER